MKRPKIGSKKVGWFNVVGVFLLAMAFSFCAAQNSKAATGSFDRENYLPSLSDSSDYDRAWITVTDSTGNTTSDVDTITVSVKAGSNSSAFVLKETGTGTGIFTTTGGTQPATYPFGTTSGYLEDFGTGSHGYPVLGSSVVGLNLKELSGNTSGNASTGESGELTVVGGSTLQLLYGGSTLDSASIGFNSGSFGFNPSSVSAVTTSSLSSPNLIISVTDGDENLNPVAKDVIGFAEHFSFSGLAPGTGTSRVQIEALDQTTGSRLSIGATEVLTKHILLVETGNDTGVFSASGRVFGSSTIASSSLTGNIEINRTGSSSAYAGGFITLGNPNNPPSAIIRLIETNATGSIALVNSGPLGGSATDGGPGFGTTTLAFRADTTPADASFSSYGTSSLSLTRAVLGALSSGNAVSLFGVPSSSANYATGSTKLAKLIDGTNYCLVEVTSFTGGTATDTTGAITANGSVSVTISSFQLAGPRSGDTLRVSYLDELTSGGTAGTTTGTVVNGVAGETGSLSADNTAPDVNDRVTVTLIDGNLNTSTSSQESVASGSGLWGGTTTNRRGDRLTVQAYSGTSKNISVSYPDNFQVGSTTVRISSTDNTYVWVVPTGASGATYGSPLVGGSSTFTLGTRTTDTIPLVRGSSSTADSFLSGASTSSFIATLNGLDNTVEISPDGTRWISVPMVETGANSSTYVGTIGFDYTAVRLTTNTSTSVTNAISDFTGTSTLYFSDGRFTTANRIDSFIGTGSVVRVFDGQTQEFAEVCSPGDTSLSITKLSNSTAFTPYSTWIQVIGNDMMTQRLDTVSTTGDEYFRIGGICGGTYRLRYNDAVNASAAYSGGDTLAITTGNFGFTNYTAELSTDITGTTGPDTFVVVTVVDQDLNTSGGSKQSTYEADSTSSGTPAITFNNENGVGVPSGTSTGNYSRGFKNGATAKIVYASTLSNILSTSVDQASGGNTIDLTLVETDNSTGTFKGSFQLSSGTSTTQTSDLLKVSNGDSVYVFYNDSPSGSACDNSSNYMSTGPITVVTSLGSLNLSKDTAYLSGDTVVATVVDVDRNTSLTTEDTLSTALKVTGSNFSIGTDVNINLVETGVNSNTFVATFKTGTTTISNATPPVVKAIQGGELNVVYSDTAPSASSVTKALALSSGDAVLAFDADSYPLSNYAIVTLFDSERNMNISSAESLLSDVFIKTSSSNSTKVRMVETGVDTGSFQGSIQVASSGGTTEFNRIQATEGDTLTITYVDEVNTSGSSQTRTDTAGVTAAVTPTPSPTPAVSPSPGVTPSVVPSPTVIPTPSGGVISGTVVDVTTAAPISGATVSTDTGGYSATTDAAGIYAIANVAAGPYIVTASATGYTSSSQAVTVIEGVAITADFALAPALPTPPPPVTPTVAVTPTPPTVCEAEAISTSPSSLTLKRKKSGDVTVTVTGAEGCPVEGETVTATINAAGKKRIKISPTSGTTDGSGAVTFTITAKKKTGNARVTFKAGDVKKSMTVKVKK